MQADLKPIDKVILKYIINYVGEHGYAPTPGEIGAEVGIKSKSAILKHLYTLQDAGEIESDKDIREPRAIRIRGYKHVDFTDDKYPRSGRIGIIRKKILPKYFEEVAAGLKTFEIRADEDHIRPGDEVQLQEWDGARYTGRYKRVRVTYVLRNVEQYGLKDGYCIFGWRA